MTLYIFIYRGISTLRDTLFYRTLYIKLRPYKGIVLTLYLHIAQEQLPALLLVNNRADSWAQIIRARLPCTLWLTPTARRESASGMIRAKIQGNQSDRLIVSLRGKPLPLTYIDCTHYHNKAIKTNHLVYSFTLSSLASILSLTKEPKHFKRSIYDHHILSK